MKLYEITIRPTAGFGTPLKGDTIFGHFCWQAYYKPSLLSGSLEKQLLSYLERPFAVFSSAYPKIGDELGRYVLKRPDLPPWMLSPQQDSEDRLTRARKAKELKRKKWIVVGKDFSLLKEGVDLLDDAGLSQALRMAVAYDEAQSPRIRKSGLWTETVHSHNTISRLTWTTGSGQFAPFTETVTFYAPGAELAIFVLVDEDATSIDRVVEAMSLIGKTGFGREASTGLGRFEVVGTAELPLPRAANANALYCLSPCVPATDSFSRAFFTPFVRFGKHGDNLARSRNPFKNPVLMADEGAVFIPTDVAAFEKPYFGRGVTGVSLVQPSAVAQGYSIYLPFRLEQSDG